MVCKANVAKTWLMEVDRRIPYLGVIENSWTRSAVFGVYFPRVSSLKLQTFMLDVDVARRVLRGIFCTSISISTFSDVKSPPVLLMSIK